MRDMRALENIINEYDDVMIDLINLQDEKLEALTNDKDEKLEEFLKTDQAFLLKMRGIDGKLSKFQKETNTENMSCREMIDLADRSTKKELSGRYERLEGKLAMYRQKADIVKSLLEVKSHAAEMVAAMMGEGLSEDDKAGIYHQNQGKDTKVNRTGKFKSKRV